MSMQVKIIKAEFNEVEVKGKKILKDTEIFLIKILNNNILTCDISRIFLAICLQLKYTSLWMKNQ